MYLVISMNYEHIYLWNGKFSIVMGSENCITVEEHRLYIILYMKRESQVVEMSYQNPH